MSKRKKVWLLTVENTTELESSCTETWYDTLLTDDIIRFLLYYAGKIERIMGTRNRLGRQWHIVNTVQIPLPTAVEVDRMELQAYLNVGIYLYHTEID